MGQRFWSAGAQYRLPVNQVLVKQPLGLVTKTILFWCFWCFLFDSGCCCGFGSGENKRDAASLIIAPSWQWSTSSVSKSDFNGLDLTDEQLRWNEVIDFPKFHVEIVIIRGIASSNGLSVWFQWTDSITRRAEYSRVSTSRRSCSFPW